MKSLKGPSVPRPSAKVTRPKPPKPQRPDTRVEEDAWNVNMTQVVAGKPQTVTKTIPHASSQEDAMRQAKVGISNPDDFAEIIAQKATGTGSEDIDLINQQRRAAMKPGGPTMTRKTSTTTQVGVAGLPESFDPKRFAYPYSMMLPESFRKLLRPMLNESVTQADRYGRIYIRVMSESAMTALVKALVKSKDKTAAPVLRGILDSMV